MCLLKTPCEDIVHDHPDATLDTYVDECPFTVHLKSPLLAARVVVKAMIHFRASMRKLGLNLSSKAGTVSNVPQAAKTISKKLLSKIIVMNACKWYRDCGAVPGIGIVAQFRK